MDNGCHVFAQRDDTYVRASLHADFCDLVDDPAYQCYEDTLFLIALYEVSAFLSGRSGAEDDSYTRDIACYQRHTEFTDDRICKMAIAWLCIGSCTIDVFQGFDKFCTESCRNT